MVLIFKPTTLSGAQWDGGQGCTAGNREILSGLIKRCRLVSLLVGVQADKQNHCERDTIRNVRNLHEYRIGKKFMESYCLGICWWVWSCCRSARLVWRGKAWCELVKGKDKLGATKANWNPENKMELASVSYHLQTWWGWWPTDVEGGLHHRATHAPDPGLEGTGGTLAGAEGATGPAVAPQPTR